MYSYLSLISVFVIVSGAIIMLLNILKTSETFKQFQSVSQNHNVKITNLIRIHGFLMLFFFFGYIGVAFSICKSIQILSDIFVAIIFFLGAIFVYLGIIIRLYMIQALTLKIEESHEIAKKLVLESEKLKITNEHLLKESLLRKKSEREKNELENRLNRSKRMDALGLLAGGIAHDLNNILSGSVSFPDLLLMDMCEDCPNKDTVREIQKSGIKAAAVVADLLTLAQSVGAKYKIDSLNRIIKDYLKSQEHINLTTRYENINYTHSLDPNLWNVSCSSAHVSKVIMNLVYNAAESIKNDGTVNIVTKNVYVEKEINSFELIPRGEYSVLEVSDTGIGISKIDSERMFEPFFTKKVLGRNDIGLGMSVVWGTMKDHSGFISLESSVEKGTTISLYFIATKSEILQTHKVKNFSSPKGNKEKILVIDDEEFQRKIVAIVLKKFNYEATLVLSGEEGIKLLQSQEFDLVLIDMVMDPGIDGLETYRRIKEFKPNQKVIIVSGFSEPKKIQEAYKLGINQYVKKPYKVDDLNIAIQKELKLDC